MLNAIEPSGRYEQSHALVGELRTKALSLRKTMASVYKPVSWMPFPTFLLTLDSEVSSPEPGKVGVERKFSIFDHSFQQTHALALQEGREFYRKSKSDGRPITLRNKVPSTVILPNPFWRILIQDERVYGISPEGLDLARNYFHKFSQAQGDLKRKIQRELAAAWGSASFVDAESINTYMRAIGEQYFRLEESHTHVLLPDIALDHVIRRLKWLEHQVLENGGWSQESFFMYDTPTPPGTPYEFILKRNIPSSRSQLLPDGDDFIDAETSD